MPDYTVQQGDCIWSIAKTAGLPPLTIWNHPNNAALKSSRKNPNILYPGDTVFIPDLNPGTFSKPTDQQHKFQVNGSTAKLRLRLLDNQKPRSGESYTLNVNGKKLSGQTDGDGWLEQMIPADAMEAQLLLNGGAEKHILKLGSLDPVDQVTGIQARLQNLGLYMGEVDGEMDDETTAALIGFQNKNNLQATGEADSATQAALQSAHGS
jgi:N-acetylmuramoyl-L-alanine amidase